ncbi:MAG: amidohydrolase family protein [Dehalococcoidia bacterium]
MSGALTIRGATLIDGRGGAPLADAAVRIEDGRIIVVGPSPSVPATEDELDAAGRYLIPGLVDMHVHIQTPNVERLPLFLAAGVTTVLDLGGQVADLLHYRRLLADGRRRGPRLLFAGPLLEEGSVFAGFSGISRQMTRSVEDEVTALADAGVDAIKLYITVRAETARRAARAAHARGLRVFMHQQATWGADAAAAGVDCLEHLMVFGDLAPDGDRPDAGKMTPFEYGGWLWRWFDQVDVDGPRARMLIGRLVESGTALDPTLVLFAARPVAMGDDGGDTALDEPERAAAVAYLAPETAADVRDRWLERRQAGAAASEQARERTRVAWAKFLHLVGMFHQAGGVVLTGTDCPNVAIVPGYSLHRELELLTRTGMSAMDVIVAATRRAAERLDRGHEFGTIAPGRSADLLILNGDPTADIKNTRRIERVIARGVAWSPEAILADLAANG